VERVSRPGLANHLHYRPGMNRRRFLVTSLAGALAAPLTGEAQRAKTPVIGVLSPWGLSLPPAGQREPFERGLRELGWTPGATIIIEQRYADGKPDRLPTLAAELIQMKVDLIVANGTHAIRAARQATTTIPIVMAAAGNPLREGHVQSLARPGGNVTGLSIMPEGRMEPKQLELLKEAVPGLTHVGVLANRIMGDPATAEINVAGRALGLRLQTFEVSSPEEIPNAFRAISQAGVGAVLVRPDPLVLDLESAQSATLASKYRLPAIHPWPGVPTRYGGLMSYNADLYDIHRRSAYYVDRILKGIPPAELPIEQPTKFELVINLKTAKTLGLTIPPSLLARADKVIE
jgi:putative tryptophan/tyrosine transport system substrate-binding protein